MNLKEFFKEQNKEMPEIDKLVVYERIRSQIEKESIFKKLSFYVKISIYSFFLLFIFFWLFYKHNKIYKTNITYADYIGKIITSTWNFKILDKWNFIVSNIIRKWDILQVSKTAHLTIQVNKWIKIYIIWPAKLEFNSYSYTDWKDIYVLNMLDWDYLTVKSNSAKDKIVIKSKYINIESDDKLIDLKYKKKWNATIIENNWWNLIIKNKSKILSLEKQEKLIFLPNNDINHIKDIFSDNYKKYQLTASWNIKEVITSKKINQLSNILERKRVIIAIWKFVLWKLNNDKLWYTSWKKQIIQIIENTYNVLWLKIQNLLKVKIKWNQATIVDLENLIDNLIVKIEAKYIIPKSFITRLKVMLAYLVIVEKIKTKKWQSFLNLSDLINYLKLDPKYKKMLLRF